MTYTRNCAQCGIIFEASRAHAKYHNDACRAAGRREMASASGRTAYQMVRNEICPQVVPHATRVRYSTLAGTPEVFDAVGSIRGDVMTGAAGAFSYGTHTGGLGVGI